MYLVWVGQCAPSPSLIKFNDNLFPNKKCLFFHSFITKDDYVNLEWNSQNLTHLRVFSKSMIKGTSFISLVAVKSKISTITSNEREMFHCTCGQLHIVHII